MDTHTRQVVSTSIGLSRKKLNERKKKNMGEYSEQFVCQSSFTSLWFARAARIVRSAKAFRSLGCRCILPWKNAENAALPALSLFHDTRTYGVQSYPFVAMFKNGKEILVFFKTFRVIRWRFVAFLRTWREQYRERSCNRNLLILGCSWITVFTGCSHNGETVKYAV